MGPRFGNENPKQHGWVQCCGACTTFRGVTDRQGDDRDWPLNCGCQVKQQALDDRGHFLQSEAVSRFRRVACENTPIDLKHCTWFEMHPACWGPSHCGEVWPTAASGSTRLGRQNRPAHHRPKRSKAKLGRTEWPRLHIHRATWPACLINRLCQRPQARCCDAPQRSG